MVFLAAIIGFVLGFAIGLGILNVLLRNRSVKDVRQNKKEKWVYGLLVWLLAFIGAFAGTKIFGML